MLFGIKHDQTEADFSHKDLGPADAILIASDLSVSGSVTVCNLRENDLGVEGWTIVFNALRDSPTSKIITWDLSSGAQRETRRDDAPGHRTGHQVAGFNCRSGKTGRKRKLLIDGFVASPPEPLRVSEFQTHRRTRLDEARAPSCLDLAYPWRFRRR